MVLKNSLVEHNKHEGSRASTTETEAGSGKPTTLPGKLNFPGLPLCVWQQGQ